MCLVHLTCEAVQLWKIKIALVIGQVSPVMYGLSSLTETIEPQNFLEKGGWVDTWIISCKQTFFVDTMMGNIHCTYCCSASRQLQHFEMTHHLHGWDAISNQYCNKITLFFSYSRLFLEWTSGICIIFFGSILFCHGVTNLMIENCTIVADQRHIYT